MGVYNLYTKFVKKRSPNSILNSKPDGKTRGLCFDLNGQLHPLAQKVFMYGKRTWTDEEKMKKLKTKNYEDLVIEFLKELNDILIRTISFFDPYEFIIIAVDGIPPIAKLKQQRIRRLKTYIDDTSSSSKENVLTPPLSDFNSAFISPGTPFMERIHEFLLLFLKENISKIRANTIIYTSFKEEGEGEHKIFERLRQPYNIEKGHFYNPSNNDNVIVWGLDGDLIMLGLCSPTNSIYLARESENSFINLDVMKKDLSIDVPNDFVFISNLIGNDFLPKNTIYSTEIPNEIELVYKKLKNEYMSSSPLNCCLTYKDNLKVNINFLFDFINEISKYETDLATETYFKQQSQKGTYYHTSSILERAFNKKTNKIDIDVYDKLVLEDLKKYDIYNELIENYEEDIAYNYLNTMLWVYTYYTQGGTEINWNYQYNYLMCPSMTYIKKVIKNGPEEFLSKRSKNIFKNEDETPFNSNGHSSIGMGELLLIITPTPVFSNIFEKDIMYVDLSKKIYFNFLDFKKVPLKVVYFEDDKSKEHEKVIILPYINVFNFKEQVDDIYAKIVSEYEIKNKDKIQEKRIKDFDKNRNLMEVNERVLKSELEINLEYKYRKPIYEKGDYVFFQRIKKPDYLIPKNLVNKDFKDAVVISVKNLELFKQKIDFKIDLKSPQKKIEEKKTNSFLKAFLIEKKKIALKSEVVKNSF